MLSDLAGGRKLNPACWREVWGGGYKKQKAPCHRAAESLGNWEQQFHISRQESRVMLETALVERLSRSGGTLRFLPPSHICSTP